VSIVRSGAGLEALRCEQCDEPLCVFACKSGALHRMPDEGRVVLDEERCLGCLMCLMVCPYGIRPDPVRDQVIRCDVCQDLDVPACVTACPTHALQAQEEPSHRVHTDFDGHVVVVGSSAAGIAACEAAREHAPRCAITVVTADEGPEYSRPLLAYALAGRLDTALLRWRPDRYLEDGIKATVVRGVRAVGLDGTRRALILSNGQEVAFDRLVIAAGARSARVSIPGATLSGVFGLRDLDDLERLNRLTKPGRRAVVLGGGNVGLQVCEALVHRESHVTLVVRSPYLLSQMVDEAVGRRVGDLFERYGVAVRTERDVVEMTGTQQVETVRLDNGEVLPADLVVVGKGIEPDLAWLKGSGVAFRRGVVVDSCNRTNMPGVFAAGDCAEAVDPVSGRSQVSGIWPVAYEMGRAAGSTAVGVERSTQGALRMNASRFFGESIISIGEVVPERLAGASGHVLVDRDGSYRKLVYRDRRLVGALLYGDVSGAGVYYRLYRESVDLGAVPPEELERVQLELALGVVRAGVRAG
jgi:NAD(P)H-nitrite reductase large subunit/Pyruvate/2-oxoacid:ferredoxin oxidoreductase delta subunit